MKFLFLHYKIDACILVNLSGPKPKHHPVPQQCLLLNPDILQEIRLTGMCQSLPSTERGINQSGWFAYS